MTRLVDRFSSAIGPLVIVIAFVAIMVPTCQMIGCNGMMGMPHVGDGTFMSSRCSGTMIVSVTPTGVIPADAFSLLLTLVAAIAAAAVVLSASSTYRPAVAFDVSPPGPPEDVRGERLRV